MVKMKNKETIIKNNTIEPVKLQLKNNIEKTPNSPNYRLSEPQQKWLIAEVERLEDQGMIEKISSNINSPVQLVSKKNTWRFTVNYKDVNQYIENDNYSLPLITERLRDLTTFKYFDKLDLSNGF